MGDINVQVAGKGRFIVNDNIVVYDIEAKEDGFHYSVDWDETQCSDEDAMRLAAEFMQKTIDGITAAE